ncbi:MAG: DUF2752 domain-containing protein [Terrimicrobiaceae bacterium]|nr:DUF2752 domain-containing protein [Terrimicrobiaceae bacterium]
MTSKRPPLLGYERWIRAGIVGAVLLVGGLSAWLGPTNWPPRLPCGFRSLTGLPCLFCGGSRAAAAVMHGDIAGAFEWNAFAMFLFAALGIVVVLLAGEALTGGRLFPWQAAGGFLRGVIPVIVLGLVVWWGFHVFRGLIADHAELVDAGHPIGGALRRAVRSDEGDL